MANQAVEISYNENLGPLEKLLGGVKRAGEFFVRDTVEVPLPKVEVEGLGILSFPLPGHQAKALIEQAELAPYGRGPETVLDTSVRKVWQLPAGKVRISGKSWGENFKHMLSRVGSGLGCGQLPVSAELYKLLVYDQGGFFLAHRDTEKSPGMFGTMIVVLPSAHQGGNLVVRHAGREVTLDLHNAEVSELTFAAFYADCEHEVQPITKGHRVCLVYNLIQHLGPGGPKRKGPLEAPLYDQEAAAVARLLEQALTEPAAPAKLAWLLEHQYTPAELSFATLKNADAARAKVLVEAATRAGCAVHLGIVHIEESGSAESNYGGYAGGRSRWSRHAEDEEEEGEEGEDVDFEIVEAYDSQEYVDGWIDPHNRKVDFGPIPLADGELLPNGALDDEKPDQQRYMEASGNEGASYERSYHRAAVVMWRQERYTEVLLQAGVGAALPYLKQKSQTASGRSASEASRREVRELAALLMERWNPTPESGYLGPGAKSPDRSEMLEALCKIRDITLLDRFIAGIVSREYDGTENSVLAKTARLLGPAQAGNLFAPLVSANMGWFPHACVDLLRRLLKLRTGAAAAEWQEALLKVATAAVTKLGDLKKVSPAADEFEETEEFGLAEEEEQGAAAEAELDWQRREKAKPPDSSVVVELLESLADLDARELRETAARTLAAQPEVFDPVKVLVPALAALHREKGSSGDPALVRLWHHAAEFLLARSERPPEPPKDWHQEATIKCHCEDCRALQRFARDPSEQVHRFPAASERRRHLHSTIEQYRLDMTHVTERKGRPYTLVCTKTRRGFERRCEQYHEEIAAMAALVPLSPEALTEPTGRLARLKAAIARSQGVAVPRGAAK